MRTTVTLDKDVERLLRDEVHRSRTSFKKALNTAIRTGLGRKTVPVKPARFVIKTRSLGLRPGLDPAGLNRLVDDLAADDFLAKHARSRRA